MVNVNAAFEHTASNGAKMEVKKVSVKTAVVDADDSHNLEVTKVDVAVAHIHPKHCNINPNASGSNVVEMASDNTSNVALEAPGEHAAHNG